MSLPFQPHAPSVPELWLSVCPYNPAAESCQDSVLSKASRVLCLVICVSVFTVPLLSLYEYDQQTELCLFEFLQHVHAFLSCCVDAINFVCLLGLQQWKWACRTQHPKECSSS